MVTGEVDKRFDAGGRGGAKPPEGRGGGLEEGLKCPNHPKWKTGNRFVAPETTGIVLPLCFAHVGTPRPQRSCAMPPHGGRM